MTKKALVANVAGPERPAIATEMDWLKRWATYSPNAIAFKDADSGVSWSFRQIYYLSCRIADELREKFDVQYGDRVACLATNEIEYVALFFAIQRLGAILVPINFRLAAREMHHILSDSEAKLLVCQSQFQDTIASIKAKPAHVWNFDGVGSLQSFIKDAGSPSGHDWEVGFEGDFEDPCMILYTSGTTGAPKGALITNKVLHWNSLNTSLRLDLSQRDVNLAFLPFFHTSGWNVLLTPFVHKGARSIILKKFDANRVLDLYEKERVTIMFGVPTIMDMMARSEKFAKADLSSIRYAIVGGEPMSLDLIRTYQSRNIPIRQGFGLTEFGPSVFSLNEEDALRKIGSIGFPNFYVEARVVDDKGKEVPANEIGELILRGPACSPGYWKNPQATAKAIRDGWFYTGDLVRKDAEGYFYVAGRKKDMFISGGENVYPTEVENYLSTHPAIREVAVIGVPDSRWGEVGKAFISLKEGTTCTSDDILKFCEGNLAKYKIPKQIAFLPDLPKGDSGKILKRNLVSN